MTHCDKKWKDFFVDHASKLESSDRNSRLVVDMSIPERISERSISNFVSEKVSIACYFSSSLKSICFLHSITDLAGGILVPESKVVAFNGFQHTAFPMLIANSSITKVTDAEVPGIASLSDLSSVQEIKDLSSPKEDDKEVLSTLPFMLLPPFLWSTAMGLRNRSPENVLLSFLSRITDFRNEIEETATFS